MDPLYVEDDYDGNQNDFVDPVDIDFVEPTDNATSRSKEVEF